MLTQQIAAWQATQTGRNPETLEQQLAALQTQLATLQSRYTDDYPDVIKMKNDIAALKKQIASKRLPRRRPRDGKRPEEHIGTTQITQLRAQVRNLDQVIAEKAREQEQIKQQIKIYQDRVQSSPAVEQQFKELTRGYQTALDSYNELQKKRRGFEMCADLAEETTRRAISSARPGESSGQAIISRIGPFLRREDWAAALHWGWSLRSSWK